MEEIISRQNSRVTQGNRFGDFDVIAPEGRGARFDSEGEFRGFLRLPRNNGLRYIREVTISDKIVGTDKYAGGAPTSVLTVMTDGKGNLITAFPGRLPR